MGRPKENNPKVAKVNREGYLYYTRGMLSPEESAMFGGGNAILQHRYVMTMHLGRPLDPKELVRHLNGDKKDNRLENLAIGDYRENRQDHLTAEANAREWRDIAMMLWAAMNA